jgi:hypothetical protein
MSAPQGAGVGHVEQRHSKRRSGCRTNHLGAPEIGGSRQRDDGSHAKCVRAANERADVARVLYGIEHEHDRILVQGDITNRARRDASDREYALWSFRVGDLREYALVHLADGSGARECCTQCLTARIVPERGRHQREFEVNAGCEEIL